MKSKSISQETLKLIACVTMLADHTAAVLVHDYGAYMLLRSIGRIAFPIYCFLLAEGAHYTKNPGKYALRLAIGAILAEIPFDLALFGGLTWQYQSVMVTMLLGFGALWAMNATTKWYLKTAVALPFVLLGDLLRVDYGSMGVMLIVLLGAVRNMPSGKVLQAAVIAMICWMLPSIQLRFLGLRFSMELVGILAVIPILLYRGKKLTHNKAVQWAFYLFYPAHLTVLLLLRLLRIG